MNFKKIPLFRYLLPLPFIFLFSVSCCSGEENNNNLQEIRTTINKGISLYKQGRNDEALPYLEKIIQQGIINPDVYYVTGEIYYARNELDKAIKHWEVAQTYFPDGDIRSKITKAKKELVIDKDLSDKISCNFVLKYNQDGKFASDLILHSLITEYNQLAYDFGWYENSEFTVILYSSEDFANILETPSWAAAIYDGKIRIPIQFTSFNIEELESIIRHELTHALLHRICGNNVPAWLHEGIAQFKDGVDDTVARDALREAVVNNHLMPINDLIISFGRFKDNNRVKIAYAESLGFVEYLIDNYGFYSILDILNNFNNYSSLDELFTATYGFDLNHLEEGWLEQLRFEYL